jgi:hypothetical protein
MDFFFNCWCLRSLQITVFGMYEGVSKISRKILDWKCSRITPQLYSVGPDLFEYRFVYENVVACGEF